MPVQDVAKVQASNATLEVEFAAIRRLCEVLETLTPTQRTAVLTYCSQRYQRWGDTLEGAPAGDGGDLG